MIIFHHETPDDNEPLPYKPKKQKKMKTKEQPATLQVDITVTENVEKTIKKEIQLPYYSKNDWHLYKITGEQKCTCVSVWDDGIHYSISNYSRYSDALKAEPCDGTEYETQILIAKSILQ